MNKLRLRDIGKRRKAVFGADGAVMAAATLAAAGMNVAATTQAAKTQAKSVIDSAKSNAEAITKQNENNTALQKESISFTRQQNQENRQQQQDIQMTLQTLAGQENANDRMRANKMELKYGGKVKGKGRGKHRRLLYGGADKPFKVTDGGGALPLQTDNKGYGLYELYGNDHEHYHKTKGGKKKTGVGIKFKSGDVVEGEGNQNTNKGELMYVTPTDAMFLSKHNIGGFNPADAVKSGVNPKDAFVVQESIKEQKGLNDDGTKKKKALGGASVLDPNVNLTQLPSNGTSGVAGGVAYLMPTSSPVAKNGKHVRLARPKAIDGAGVSSNKGFWNNYGGAVMNAGANFAGAGINFIGNTIAGNKLANAYRQAAAINADAYSRLKTIDMSEVKRDDFAAPHTLAVVRSADTNINPQLERIRRNSSAETREINRGTMSSAARQQRLAATNDRMQQKMSEQYAYKQNEDEKIKQANAERITQSAQANADRDVAARKNWADQRLAVLQYNNDIENSKILGMAGAQSEGLTGAAGAKATALQSSISGIGQALINSGNAFAASYNAVQKEKQEFDKSFYGLGDAQQVTAAIRRAENNGDLSYIKSIYDKVKNAQANHSDLNGNSVIDSNFAHKQTIEAWAKANGVDLTKIS